MKYLFFLLLVVASCTTQPKGITVLSTDPLLQNRNGTWYYNDKRLDGCILEKDSSYLISRLPVRNGKEEGVAYGYFSNGSIKYERHYQNGNREGWHRGWYENRQPAFEYYFHRDQFEGVQKTYFRSGRIWQQLHYANGYEEGKQQSWNDSGRLVNNFNVKKGKLYGVIGRFDCMSVVAK